MDIAADIVKLVDYIEDHLEEKPSLDDIAGKAGWSKYHFHRVFRAVTGQAVGDYMLSRRLARSVTMLSGTSLRTSDIAAELGFYDHSAFSHAFRKEFGVTPTQYRRRPVELPVRGRLSAADLHGSSEALITRPDFVSKPPFTVIGRPHRIFYMDNVRYNKANLAGIDFFDRERCGIIGRVHGDVYIGLTLFPQDDDRFTWYIPSVEVQDDSPVPPGMVRHRIPAQGYAVFHYVGFHSRERITEHMIPLFQHVFSQWMPNSRFKSRSMFFERIDMARCSDEYYEVDLCLSLTPPEREECR